MTLTLIQQIVLHIRGVAGYFGMRRVEVTSTSLQSIGYDQASKLLEVEFRSGAVYHYHDVPYRVARGLASATSVGAYFMRHIRGAYGYARVE